MTQPDIIITLATLIVAVVLFVGNVLRNDLVAVLIVLALSIGGVLAPAEALSGFSSNAVIIIACMFIVGRAITYTGIAQQVGEAIIHYGGSNEKRLLLLVMTAAAFVGAFMSSTATAAIFIPITLSVAEKAGLNHRRLLMPLAAAALISGMMTLVATTPNIIINSALLEQGLEGLGFFSFTPFGMLALVLCAAFMAVAGQRLLSSGTTSAVRKSDPTIDDLLRYHSIDKNEYLLRIPAHSDLVGKSVASMQINATYHVILLAVERSEHGRRKTIFAARPETVFHEDDVMLVVGCPNCVQSFAETFSLQFIPFRTSHRKAFFQVVGIAEVMLNPESTLIGKSLKETLFQSSFHSMALGIRRKGETLTENLADIPLKFGDVLLLCGAWTDILLLRQHREQYLLLTMPKDAKEYVPAPEKRNVTLAVLACMVALMVFNLLPPVTAILAATAALLLLRCVPMTSVYTVVDWQTIVMIAGILPLALALQKTGVIGYVSEWFLGTFSGAGPLAVLAGLFLITALLGLFMSNTPVAILMAPMAVGIGQSMQISPQACAMTVAIACSSAFISPLGSPVALLVREPGGYGFLDYAKTGVPMLILSLAATLLLCRLIYL